MPVHPDEKVPIARLLTFLEHGERMAHDYGKSRALTDAMVLTLRDLFDRIDEGATVWAHDARAFLPVWCLA